MIKKCPWCLCHGYTLKVLMCINLSNEFALNNEYSIYSPVEYWYIIRQYRKLAGGFLWMF